MNLETKIIIYKFTPQVFTLTQDRFPIANKVFPLIEQVVSLWRTLCFP